MFKTKRKFTYIKYKLTLIDRIMDKWYILIGRKFFRNVSSKGRIWL